MCKNSATNASGMTPFIFHHLEQQTTETDQLSRDYVLHQGGRWGEVDRFVRWAVFFSVTLIR